MTAGRSPQTDAMLRGPRWPRCARPGRSWSRSRGRRTRPSPPISAHEGEALRVEFKAALNAYLASTPPKVTARTIDALIDFDNKESRETPLFGQEIFEERGQAPRRSTDKGYLQKPRRRPARLARAALDKMMQDNSVEALVGPSTGPATIVDPIDGSRSLGSYSTLPAVSGYPHLDGADGRGRRLAGEPVVDRSGLVGRT